MNFDIEYFFSMFPIILSGFPTTVEVAGVSLVFSVIIGFIIAAFRYYNIPVLKQLSIVFVSFFRSTPFIAQLFVFYYGIAQVSRIVRNMSSFWATIIVLSLSFAAYMSEDIRGAIMSVDKGQFEAGLSIGLSTWQTIYRIIIPQAVRVAIPGMMNSFANLFKSTSLCFIVGLKDMIAYCKNETNVSFRYLEGYMAVLIIYWIILSLISYLQSRLEKYMNKAY
ncbi:amino acid ABC transporter permease [Lutispora thermophila]|uniref:Amino acid ABC transporter membrane protein, PAAT family (TC 3.A.1.3.-) n=1 Tax=Lutispora thermophila DSM 19022 TaxID=1122184 RepID=A0A1M6DVC4_9FIRM|nr:amino acid ABC transporter permease [Lutispora thermophila]SHI77079.1 amino acid ABC transporter membrane protein, PAAT family (TC 3.A.1.3.-) [Lutispora thermophila DSM 19022]